MSRERILVVDDEPSMALAISKVLEGDGHPVDRASDGLEALALHGRHRHPVVISDMRMPRCGGADLLKQIRTRCTETQVILISAFGTVEQAVESVKNGAFDYVLKPFAPEVLSRTVRAALARREAAGSGPAPAASLDTAPEIVTHDPAMRELLDAARRAAATDATVLLVAESGTGKELLARRIHLESPRASGPFVALNCAALPETLLESELFGADRGAFTGAQKDRRGHIERAHGGTLFLDEVGDCPPSLQAKLLRVLEQHEVLRLGSERPVAVDIRVIAATNLDLHRAVSEDRFREDLFYRLNVIPLKLPPLRARPEDIRPLAEHFCRRYAATVPGEGGPPELSREALAALKAHAWPGNVRELENIIHRAVVLSGGGDLTPDDLFLDERPAARNGVGEDLPIGVPLDEVERRMIERTLDCTGGNRTRASAMLGISVRTLRNKLRRYREESAGGLHDGERQPPDTGRAPVAENPRGHAVGRVRRSWNDSCSDSLEGDAMSGIGDDPVLGMLERVLNVAARRQTMLSSNIANLETPGYRTVDIDWDKALKLAVSGRGAGPDAAHTAERVLSAREVQGLPVRADRNNVDLDREMLAISETRGRYETAIEMLRHRLRVLRMAVTDGRSG